MGRPNPKAKSKSPNVFTHGATLSESAKESLSDYLGKSFDDDSVYDVFRDIELWLGFYVDGGQEALENEPRAADYRQTFRSIQKKALKLYNELAELNEYYSEQFTLQKVDINQIEQSLCTLIDCSNSIVKEKSQYSSKGARPNVALKKIIFELRCIFRKYYSGKRTKRKKQGGIEYKTHEEKNEIKFVEACLCDSRIIAKKDSIKTVERYFRDPNCIPQ